LGDCLGDVLMATFVFPLSLAHLGIAFVCWIMIGYIPMAKVHAQTAVLVLRHRARVTPEKLTAPTAVVLSQLKSRGAVICQSSAPCWDLLMMRLTIGLSVLSTALLCALITTAVLLMSLDTEQHKLVMDQGVHSGDSSYTTGLAVALGVAIALLQHVLRSVTYHLMELCPSFAGIVLANIGGLLVPAALFWCILSAQLNNLAQEVFSFALIVQTIVVPGVSMMVAHMRSTIKMVPSAQNGAVVRCVLLMSSVVGLFTPTVFYNIYGRMEMDCKGCLLTTAAQLSCSQCRYVRKDFGEDIIYQVLVKPLGYCCALLMPVPYWLSLVYLVFTHASVFETNQEPEPASLAKVAQKPAHKQESGSAAEDVQENPLSHDKSEKLPVDEHTPSQAPDGAPADAAENQTARIVLLSVVFCMVAAMVCLASNSFVAAIRNAGWETEQGNMTLSASLVVAVLTYSTILTAIDFALIGEVAVGIDIANMAAIQHSMVLMPLLVLFSVILSATNSDDNVSFSLVFPTLSFIGVLASTAMLNYVTLTGRTRALTGIMMVVLFCLWLAMYAHVPSHQDYLQREDLDQEALDTTGRDGTGD